LPLRNTVLFPGVAIPITVGRDKSILAVKEAYKGKKLIGVVGQLDPSVEEPEYKDLFQIGTVAQILRMIKMPDGSTTAIIQGRNRFVVADLISSEPYIKAKIELLHDIMPEKDKKFDVVVESIKDLANNIIKQSPQIPSDASILLKNISNPVTLVHFISSNLNIEIGKKQKLLEIADMRERVQLVLKYLQEELQMLEMKNEIQNKVKGEFDKQQRDYFLNQQLKTIQDELGVNNTEKDIQRLRDKMSKLQLTPQVKEAIEKELEKLQRMNPAAAEFSVVMNYVDLVLDLPWGVYTKDHFNIKKFTRSSRY
jgi:ATP-dependent Lon protease